MTTTVTAKIQLRHGTAAQWTSANPVLLSGEVGYETDTQKQKLGDGVTAWNSLSYYHDPDLISDHGALTGLSDDDHSQYHNDTRGDARYSLLAHDHNATYAPIANGVTNGDSHDHSGGDGGQIAYSGLSGLPTLGSAAAQNTTAFEAAGTVSTHAALTSAVHGISSFGASLVDDADASAARTTLGLGSAATTASTDYATAGHTHAQLHDAVTVADSSSIDLTLTGQQVSAAAIFGTTSGTVCQGNDSRVVNAVQSDPTGITGADAITNIVSLTQAEYDAIGSPSATTLYIITDA